MAGVQVYMAGNVRRLAGVEMSFPIVSGSVAWPLGKRMANDATHRWHVYLRGPSNEDLSFLISKVTFELHHTFDNAIRTVVEPPWEIQEHGWGEFDIGITISFHQDAHEQDVKIFHKLQLYENNADTLAVQSTKKPVVSESYDELVFVDVAEDLYRRISGYQPGPLRVPYTQQAWFPQHISEAEDLEAIRQARLKVAQQAQQMREQFEAGAV